MNSIVFFDIETSIQPEQITDIGAIRSDGARFHKNSVNEFMDFIKGSRFLCGHNIIQHDLKILQQHIGYASLGIDKAIDTLFLSPLLFPQKPYHRLLKDDKIQTEERNNPLNDAIKARELFYDEVAAFDKLHETFKTILFNLTGTVPGFSAFFQYVQFEKKLTTTALSNLIKSDLHNLICEQADMEGMIENNPVSLAFALSLINCNDRFSIMPPWVLKNHPDVERIFFLLRNSPCITGCNYCSQSFDPYKGLKEFFGYDTFRTYNGEPLQEKAIRAAINNQSLLCIFPTGGGKSLTFQIPALLSGQHAKALTVVISPLQSLMKDQVDNLEKKGITEAVTINAQLDPIERSKSIERVEEGLASMLYISPESLRSVTIERLLLKRKIARFVIDEAHCFSAWGQDFRVDYLYIGDFIRALQVKKNLDEPIPVSCFTATAKPKVIEDIVSYFHEKLGIRLEIIRANATRTNLHYRVYQKDNEEDKYQHLRTIIESRDCPVIVYVSRTRKSNQLAQRLTADGFPARPYHGQLPKEVRMENQNAFMSGEVNIMVATSAFGMGVDKSDVGAVIHYDISDSLENYIQEAGRAGRDENLQAGCFILFNEEDLNKHFILLNQTKIGSKEINQVWKAIKDMTRTRNMVSNSALEIARKAGWDDRVSEIETRVLTAIAALEEAGYIKRGQNMPRVYANSILSKTAEEALKRIRASEKIPPEYKQDAERIIRKLFSSKSKRLATDELAESRVDYIADQLGLVKDKVIRIIELLREENILAQTKDLTAFIKKGENSNQSNNIIKSYGRLENFFLSVLKDHAAMYHLKELNERALQEGIADSTPLKLRTIINFWAIKNWIKKHFVDGPGHYVRIKPVIEKEAIRTKLEKRHWLASRITEYLYNKSLEITSEPGTKEILIEFSVLELKEMAERQQEMFAVSVSHDDIEDALFYLSRMDAIKIEGGFLVVYNRLTIDRLEKNPRIQYKESDYEKLGQFYQQKVQQIHIVGEYAKKMIQNYTEALQFVEDYFSLNYSSFLNKYFPGSRQTEIKRTLTPAKFQKLFGSLSVNQLKIINDSQHQYIVVAAGPGSGKTRVLVHKLASLLLTEDVKHEQLLMLTFSRAAATEFKKRLKELIGNAAAFIEIKTFHSYCFDLLGRVGNLEEAENVVKTAVEKIRSGDIERNRMTKTVLVVDEAQDMNVDEFSLIRALMDANEDMRVILVGDDDQNIFAFRGADSKYMQKLLTENNAIKYELTENYRSKPNIVAITNQWAATIRQRLKTQPSFPVRDENGDISINEYHTDSGLIVPLSTAVSQTELAGTTCILTTTNEEAMLGSGLLRKNGRSARLIQSNEGFSLYNLYELRYFSDRVLKDENDPVISPECWSEAVRRLSLHARQSRNLELALNVIRKFESVNERKKYKSDWKTFLFESRMEDFISIHSETIYVSTIHKAKGKEFDNVFILLNQFRPNDDEEKRQLYVALTRAKNNLHIHYNGSYLQCLTAENLVYRRNNTRFPEPEHLALSLTHRDVKLGYFEYVQHRMNGLYSGSPLTKAEDGLGNSDHQLLIKYSNSFRQHLESYFEKGYNLKSATVNFIVYWKNPEKDLESKIILPEIILEKGS